MSKHIGRHTYPASIVYIFIYRTDTMHPDSHNLPAPAPALVKAKVKAKHSLIYLKISLINSEP